MPIYNDDKPDQASKTQRKKDMLALQKLGETLIELPESQLAKISLPSDLLREIQLARSLTSRESRRRQLQYIGKIMRHLDAELIQKELKNIQLTNKEQTAEFHLTEKWRDRLIAEGDQAIKEFLDLYPLADRQQLRQLIRKAQHDIAKQTKTGGETQLFKYLRELIQS